MNKPVMIRNRAQLLRAIVPGCVIETIAHFQPQLVGTTRTPTKIQTNGYFFSGTTFSGKPDQRMWAEIPKASELRFNDDGTVTFHPGTEKTWTQRFYAPAVG